MILIPTPDLPYSEVVVSLDNKTYTFIYRYVSLTNIVLVDIYLNNTPLVLGEALEPFSPLFYNKPIEGFNHGVLVVLSRRETTSKCTLGTIGIDKDYTLVYLTNKEWYG